MDADSRDPYPDPRLRSEKNRLYCPYCDHASPTTGDWLLEVHETGDESLLAYRCPECSNVITRRPSRE